MANNLETENYKATPEESKPDSRLNDFVQGMNILQEIYAVKPLEYTNIIGEYWQRMNDLLFTLGLTEKQDTIVNIGWTIPLLGNKRSGLVTEKLGAYKTIEDDVEENKDITYFKNTEIDSNSSRIISFMGLSNFFEISLPKNSLNDLRKYIILKDNSKILKYIDNEDDVTIYNNNGITTDTAKLGPTIYKVIKKVSLKDVSYIIDINNNVYQNLKNGTTKVGQFYNNTNTIDLFDDEDIVINENWTIQHLLIISGSDLFDSTKSIIGTFNIYDNSNNFIGNVLGKNYIINDTNYTLNVGNKCTVNGMEFQVTTTYTGVTLNDNILTIDIAYIVGSVSGSTYIINRNSYTSESDNFSISGNTITISSGNDTGTYTKSGSNILKNDENNGNYYIDNNLTFKISDASNNCILQYDISNKTFKRYLLEDLIKYNNVYDINGYLYTYNKNNYSLTRYFSKTEAHKYGLLQTIDKLFKRNIDTWGEDLYNLLYKNKQNNLYPRSLMEILFGDFSDEFNTDFYSWMNNQLKKMNETGGIVPEIIKLKALEVLLPLEKNILDIRKGQLLYGTGKPKEDEEPLENDFVLKLKNICYGDEDVDKLNSFAADKKNIFNNFLRYSHLSSSSSFIEPLCLKYKPKTSADDDLSYDIDLDDNFILQFSNHSKHSMNRIIHHLGKLDLDSDVYFDKNQYNDYYENNNSKPNLVVTQSMNASAYETYCNMNTKHMLLDRAYYYRNIESDTDNKICSIYLALVYRRIYTYEFNFTNAAYKKYSLYNKKIKINVNRNTTTSNGHTIEIIDTKPLKVDINEVDKKYKFNINSINYYIKNDLVYDNNDYLVSDVIKKYDENGYSAFIIDNDLAAPGKNFTIYILELDAFGKYSKCYEYSRTIPYSNTFIYEKDIYRLFYDDNSMKICLYNPQRAFRIKNGNNTVGWFNQYYSTTISFNNIKINNNFYLVINNNLINKNVYSIDGNKFTINGTNYSLEYENKLVNDNIIVYTKVKYGKKFATITNNIFTIPSGTYIINGSNVIKTVGSKSGSTYTINGTAYTIGSNGFSISGNTITINSGNDTGTYVIYNNYIFESNGFYNSSDNRITIGFDSYTIAIDESLESKIITIIDSSEDNILHYTDYTDFVKPILDESNRESYAILYSNNYKDEFYTFSKDIVGSKSSSTYTINDIDYTIGTGVTLSSDGKTLTINKNGDTNNGSYTIIENNIYSNEYCLNSNGWYFEKIDSIYHNYVNKNNDTNHHVYYTLYVPHKTMYFEDLVTLNKFISKLKNIELTDIPINNLIYNNIKDDSNSKHKYTITITKNSFNLHDVKDGIQQYWTICNYYPDFISRIKYYVNPSWDENFKYWIYIKDTNEIPKIVNDYNFKANNYDISLYWETKCWNYITKTDEIEIGTNSISVLSLVSDKKYYNYHIKFDVLSWNTDDDSNGVVIGTKPNKTNQSITKIYYIWRNFSTVYFRCDVSNIFTNNVLTPEYNRTISNFIGKKLTFKAFKGSDSVYFSEPIKDNKTALLDGSTVFRDDMIQTVGPQSDVGITQNVYNGTEYLGEKNTVNYTNVKESLKYVLSNLVTLDNINTEHFIVLKESIYDDVDGYYNNPKMLIPFHKQNIDKDAYYNSLSNELKDYISRTYKSIFNNYPPNDTIFNYKKVYSNYYILDNLEYKYVYFDSDGTRDNLPNTLESYIIYNGNSFIKIEQRDKDNRYLERIINGITKKFIVSDNYVYLNSDNTIYPIVNAFKKGNYYYCIYQDMILKFHIESETLTLKLDYATDILTSFEKEGTTYYVINDIIYYHDNTFNSSISNTKFDKKMYCIYDNYNGEKYFGNGLYPILYVGKETDIPSAEKLTKAYLSCNYHNYKHYFIYTLFTNEEGNKSASDILKDKQRIGNKSITSRNTNNLYIPNQNQNIPYVSTTTSLVAAKRIYTMRELYDGATLKYRIIKDDVYEVSNNSNNNKKYGTLKYYGIIVPDDTDDTSKISYYMDGDYAYDYTHAIRYVNDEVTIGDTTYNKNDKLDEGDRTITIGDSTYKFFNSCVAKRCFSIRTYKYYEIGKYNKKTKTYTLNDDMSNEELQLPSSASEITTSNYYYFSDNDNGMFIDDSYNVNYRVKVTPITDAQVTTKFEEIYNKYEISSYNIDELKQDEIIKFQSRKNILMYSNLTTDMPLTTDLANNRLDGIPGGALSDENIDKNKKPKLFQFVPFGTGFLSCFANNRYDVYRQRIDLTEDKKCYVIRYLIYYGLTTDKNFNIITINVLKNDENNSKIYWQNGFKTTGWDTSKGILEFYNSNDYLDIDTSTSTVFNASAGKVKNSSDIEIYSTLDEKTPVSYGYVNNSTPLSSYVNISFGNLDNNKIYDIKDNKIYLLNPIDNEYKLSDNVNDSILDNIQQFSGRLLFNEATEKMFYYDSDIGSIIQLIDNNTVDIKVDEKTGLIIENEDNKVSISTAFVKLFKPDESFVLYSGDRTLKVCADGNLIWSGQAMEVTSDERKKYDIVAIPDNVLSAWNDVNWYQYKLVDDKPELAKYHTGLIAQRINDAFSKYNLKATDYGVVHYDDIIDFWTVRYAEAQAIEAAYQRKRTDMLEKRIEELEKVVKTLMTKKKR